MNFINTTTNYNLTLFAMPQDAAVPAAQFINEICGYDLSEGKKSNMQKLDDALKQLSDHLVTASTQNGYIKINNAETKVYELPVSNTNTLGGVKVGNNITNNNGVISITATNVTNALQAVAVQNATHANNADSATHATTADSATTAGSATSATNATNATHATNATNADNATHATSADSATSATTAVSAGNGWWLYTCTLDAAAWTQTTDGWTQTVMVSGVDSNAPAITATTCTGSPMFDSAGQTYEAIELLQGTLGVIMSGARYPQNNGSMLFNLPEQPTTSIQLYFMGR